MATEDKLKYVHKVKEVSDDLSLSYLIAHYLDNRKHKRWKPSSVEFEVKCELELLSLLEEYKSDTYKVSKFKSFIVSEPKLREVFAASFRDRISQAIIVNETKDVLEEYLSDFCYNCRDGRGTLHACIRLHNILQVAKPGDWILGLDLRSFFMNIIRDLTANDFTRFVSIFDCISNKELVIKLADKIIRCDPTINSEKRGALVLWDRLPKHKSLYHRHTGLPIGDQLSQSLSNFVLTILDRFLETKDITGFVRYVDDLRIVGPKDLLLRLINEIDNYLKYNIGIELNRSKIYFQPYKHGAPFVGYYVREVDLYPGKRVVNKIYALIHKINTQEFNTYESKQKLMATVNSYLGYLKPCRSYNLRKLLVMTILNKSLGFYSFKGFYKIKLSNTSKLQQYGF